MYLVGSVGTDHHPFPRFVEWLSIAQRAVDFDATIQCGSTPSFGHLIDAKLLDFLPTDQLAAELTKADIVVSHGGPGTISMAMRCGHRPIVIARDPQRGEHVDDHQQRYVRRLAAEGRIDSAETVEQLVAMVADPQRRRVDPLERTNEPIVAAGRFGELIGQLVAGSLPRRPLRTRLLVRRSI